LKWFLQTGRIFPYALNDVTVSRKETTSMITVDSYINDEFLNVFWGDGVIVSTPTGSTAYSLSCGGPIISPNNENFVITPIAPHNLNVRPLVVNDKVEIKFGGKPSSTIFLSLDSRLIHIETDKEIIIKKLLSASSGSAQQFKFLRNHPSEATLGTR
jgi:NAD+ kinase